MREVLLLPPTPNGVYFRNCQINSLAPYFVISENKSYSNVFSLFQLILSRKKNIVVMDWFHMYYSHPSSILKTAIKSCLFVLWFLIVLIRKDKIFVNLHNLRPHDSKWKRIDYYLHRFVLNNATKVRCFSHYNSHLVKRYFKLKNLSLFVAYEGSKKENNNIQKNKNVVRSHKPPLFLIIGQVRKYKRIKEAVTDLSDLINKGCIRLRIVGNAYDTQYSEELKGFIKKFSGAIEYNDRFITDDQFNTEIENADFVLINAKRNYNSGVLSKCIMLNKPCCVRDQYGNTERMDYNKNFLIYNDNVKEAVTRCLSIKLTNANKLYSNKYPDEETFAKALTVDA